MEDRWLDDQLDAAPFTLVGGLRNDPTYNRLTSDIHDAVKQFNAVNAPCSVLNVPAFVSHEEGCDERDLIAVLTGTVVWSDGEEVPMFRKFSDGRIKESKYLVDLYLWFEKERLVYMLFGDRGDAFLNSLRGLFQIDPNATIPQIRGTY